MRGIEKEGKRHRPGGSGDLNAKFRTEPPPISSLSLSPSPVPLELSHYPLVEFYVIRYIHASLCRRAGNSGTGQEFHVSHPFGPRGRIGGENERWKAESDKETERRREGDDGSERA